MLEFFGGLAIALGLLTHPVAFLLAGEMATAYFVLQHLPQGFWPILNEGEPALLYLVIFPFLMAHGAGAFSLDELLRRQREDAQRQAAATYDSSTKWVAAVTRAWEWAARCSERAVIWWYCLRWKILARQELLLHAGTISGPQRE